MPVSDTTDSVQTQVLDLLNKAQGHAVESVRSLAETIEGRVPELPALPFGDRLPEPSSVVDRAFDFAEKLLHSQRVFAQDLFAAASPVVKSATKDETAKPKAVVTKKSA